MNIYECLVSKEPIEDFVVFNERLYLKTQTHYFMIDPKEGCEAKESISCKSFKTQNSFFSHDASVLALLFHDRVEIFDYKKQKIINCIAKKGVQKGLFFQHYFLLVTKHEIFVYAIDCDFFLDAYYFHETITDILFHDGVLYVALFDEKVVVYDFFQKRVIKTYYTPLSPYKIALYDKGFICGNIDGSVTVFEDGAKKTLTTPLTKAITSLVISNNTLYVASSEEELYAIDLEAKKLQKRVATFDVGIKKIASFHEELLVVQLVSDRVSFVMIEQEKEQIKQQQKSFKVEILESFLALYREKKFAYALNLASKYPILQNRAEYEEMQRDFLKRLKVAAKYILKNQMQEARELIAMYVIDEQKREVVKLLLEYREHFLEFLSAYAQKDYKRIFELSKEHRAFCASSLYQIIEQEVTQKLDAIYQEILQEQISLDSKEFLEQVVSYNKKAKELLLFLKQTQRLQDYFAQKRFVLCYEMIDEELALTKSAKMLTKLWQARVLRCEELVCMGDFEAVVEELRGFFVLEQFEQKIVMLLKRSLLRKIEQTDDFSQAERLYIAYVELFSKDAMLERMREQKEKEFNKRFVIVESGEANWKSVL